MTRNGVKVLFVIAASLLMVASTVSGSDVEIPLPEGVIAQQEGRYLDGCWSPVGQYVALATMEGVVELRDAKTLELVRHLSGHTRSVRCVAFNLNGDKLASGSADYAIKLWDVATGQETWTFLSHTWYVVSIAFSPDGEKLASGSWDGTIKLWDVETGREIHTLMGHANSVASVAFNLDGRVLASGSFDSTIKLWNAETGQEIRTLTAHQDTVHSVAFSPDGETLVSGSADHTIKLWNVETGKLIRTLTGHPDTVYSVAFSPDGGTLSSGSADGTIKLWDVAAGELIQTFSAPCCYSTGFSPDGTTLASVCGGVFLWDVLFLIPQEPRILVIDARSSAAEGLSYVLSVAFLDSNEDVAQLRVSVLEGPLDDFTLDLTQPPYAEYVVDQSEGEFSFEIIPSEPGSYLVQLILVDANGLESEPLEFSFEAYMPTPPSISRVTFPSSVGVNEDQNGLIRFEDAEGDIVEARFEVIEGDASTIEIDPGLSFDPNVGGETDGAFRFTVRVTQPQTVTLRLILVDTEGLESEPYEFTFAVE